MHQDFNEDQNHQLDEDTLKKINAVRDALNLILGEMGPPMDPKAIGLIEMAVDMLEEQVIMDKYYDYPDCPTCTEGEEEKPDFKMLFFKNKEGPSVNDLNDMFDTKWMDNDNP